MGTKLLSVLVMVVHIPIIFSCRVLPIQMIRVSQSETFVQTFEFAKEKENKDIAIDVLERQIGERNLKVLKDNYYKESHIEDLTNGYFEARGNINVNFSISPKDHATFFLDGNGRYFIVNKAKGHILYTSDFNLIPKHYDLRLLAVRQEIILEFNQQLINHFILPSMSADEKPDNNWNFEVNRKVSIHVKIYKVFPKKEIYSIDYDTRHSVMVDDLLVGHIVFDKPVDPFDKIIDLRGMKFLRNDYRKLPVR